MKKSVLSALFVGFLVLIGSDLSAQCMLYPVSLQERIQSSPVIIEGKVLSKKSFWNTDHSHIVTSNTVEIHKILASNLGTVPTQVEIITQGGEVGDNGERIDPSLQLFEGNIGVFFLMPAKIVDLNSGISIANVLKFEVFADQQGFVMYKDVSEHYNDIFNEYDDLSLVYAAISLLNGQNPVIVNTSASNQPVKHARSQAFGITSYSPATITAGTTSMLTINGTDFGATAGIVQFFNVNDGGASLVGATPLTWNNTQITVRVPTGAGAQSGTTKGVFRVYMPDNTTFVESDQNFNIIYNQTNSGTNQPNLANFTNGGYLMKYSNGITNNGVSFDGDAAAKASYNRSLETWRCNTLVNISVNGTSTVNRATGDGINIVTYDNDSQVLSGGVLGTGASYYGGCSTGFVKVTEIDITFKRNNSGVVWNYGPAINSGSKSDFESVSLHELGHIHQLGHVIASGHVMHFAITQGTQNRVLNQTRDIDGGNYVLSHSTTSSCAPMTKLTPGNCGINAPISAFTSDKTSGCVPLTVNFTDQSTATPTTWAWTFGDGTTSTAQNPSKTYSAAGVYNVKLKVTNASGTDSLIKSAFITVNAPVSLPFTQDFEGSTFPPTGFSISTDIGAGDVPWARGSVSGFGNGTGCAVLKNDNIDNQVNRNSVFTPPLNFTGINNPVLEFDVAYQRYFLNPNDSLVVYYSTDCGLTFIRTSYAKGYSNLFTSDNSQSSNYSTFTPTASQWRKETVSLSNLANFSNVVIELERGFTASGASNDLYIDNINVAELPIPPVANFSANATQICSGDSVQFTDLSTNNPNAWAWTFANGSPATSNIKNPKVKFTGAGNSTVTLTATNSVGSDGETKTNYISITTPSVSGTAATGTNTICAGSSVSINLSGFTGTIQWQSATGVNAFANIASQTSATLNTGNLSETTKYRAIVTNGVCASATSNEVTITVSPATAAGNATPVNSALCAGTGTTITLAGNTGTIQWQISSDNINFTNINGQTASALNTGNITQTTYYRAVVTSGVCASQNTNTVTITVSRNTVAGTVLSNNNEICSGGSAIISLSGNTGSIQWQSSTDNITFTNVNGQTAQTLNTGALNQKMYYRAIVKSGTCSAINTNTVTVNVVAGSIAGTATVPNANLCQNSSTTITLSSSSGAIQWESSANGTVYANVVGQTNATINTGSLSDTIFYRAKVGGGTCPEVFSNAIKLNVAEAPVAGNSTSNTTAVCGSSCATLTITGSKGVIQWFMSTDNGVNFTLISGANAATYLACPTVKTQYKARLSNANCTDVFTEIITVDVIAQPMPGTATSNRDTACKNTDVLFQLVGSQGAIQWQTSTNGADFSNVTNENANTYFISGIQTSSFIRARVGGGTCPEVFSNAKKIVVNNPALSGTASISKTNVCEGDNATINLTGFDGNIQWQKENQSGGYDNIMGENANALNLNNVSESAKYRAQVSKKSCISELSNIIEINSVPRPGAPSVQGRNSICTGEMVQLRATTGSPNNNYEWYDAAEGGVLLIASDVISISPSQTKTYYAQTLANGCASTTRTAYTVKVNQNPTVLSIVSDTVCRGDMATLAINTSNSKDIVKWYNTQTGGTPIFIGKTLITPRVFNSKTYFVETESDQGCKSNIRTPVNALVRNSGIDFSADKNDVGTDYTVKFTSIGASGSTYSWEFGDGGTSTDANPNHQYSTEGIFTVRLITINYGCKDTLTKQQFIHVDKALFVNKNLHGSIKLYPNPATNIINLENINDKFTYDVIITDIIGRTIDIVKIKNADKHTFDVSRYESGSYQMQIISNTNAEVFYFQKK